MGIDYFEAIKKRRSIYNLTNESTIEKYKIEEIIKNSLDHTPSAFNSQTGRIVLLYENDHNSIWEMIEQALKKIQPIERHEETEEKINGFKNSYGTILFFEDYEIVENLQNKYKSAKDKFPLYSYQSSGMLQYNIWTSFAVEGMGASLQHYIEPVEEDIKAKWNIPTKWKLISQMPFGKIVSPAKEKEIIEASKKLKIFGLD